MDDTIGSTWGYTDGMKIASAASIIGKLVDTVSKGGFYLLNISPRADGTIPDEQQQVLLGIGAWLQRYGEAIYDTHPWTRFGDGDWRYTVKNGALYAIGKLTGSDAALASLTPDLGTVEQVDELGAKPVAFTQDASGLHLRFDGTAVGPLPVALRISGLRPR